MKCILLSVIRIYMPIFFGAASVSAQVTFTEVDSGNTVGITSPGDSIGFA